MKGLTNRLAPWRRLVPVGLMALVGVPGLAVPELLPVPQPNLGAMEETVRRQLTAAHRAVESLAADPAPDPPTLARAYGDLGSLYAAYELYDAAWACFSNALHFQPQDPRWRHLLGYVQYQRGEIAAAAESFAAVTQTQPDSLAAWIRLGNARLELGDAAAARQAFERALTLDSRSPAAHYGMGRAASLQGDHAAAANHFRQALALQPEATEIHYPLARAYRQLGDLASARRHLEQRGESRVSLPDPLVGGLTRQGAGAALHAFHADRALLEKRYTDAAAGYRQAVQAAPQNFHYRKALAMALFRLGKTTEAQTELGIALGLDPGGTPGHNAREKALVHYALAGLHFNRGEGAQALKEVQAALKLHPALEEAYLLLGNLHGRAGRLEEALDAFTRLLAHNPHHPEGLQQRATTLMDLGRFGEAIPDLETLVSLQPGNDRARWLLRVARERADKE